MESDRDILLQHVRQPCNSGFLSDASHMSLCRNPRCGDAVLVSLRVKDSRIEAIRVQASGCTMAIASASMMCESVEGSARDTALSQSRMLQALLVPLLAAQAEGVSWPEALGSVRALRQVRRNPAKIPCAVLAWKALQDALERSD